MVSLYEQEMDNIQLFQMGTEMRDDNNITGGAKHFPFYCFGNSIGHKIQYCHFEDEKNITVKSYA